MTAHLSFDGGETWEPLDRPLDIQSLRGVRWALAVCSTPTPAEEEALAKADAHDDKHLARDEATG